MADGDRTRPDWWEPWVPIRCGGCGLPWVPGGVSLTWENCGCPGAGEAHGHQVHYCAADRVWPGAKPCHWHIWPPEHTPGATTPERGPTL